MYWFDPGDMRTQMHQDAFPGEDISDRPEPETVVPALRRLLADAPAERPLPRRRPAGGAAVTAADTVERPRARPDRRGWRFDLPPELEAREPPEARGLTRDAVRMMVAHRADRHASTHSTFALLPAFLEPGDLVVVNTSGTIPAALDAVAADGTPLVVHLSTQLDDGRWVVEPRRPAGRTHRALVRRRRRRRRSRSAPDAVARARRAVRRQPAGCGSPGCDLPQPRR